MYQDDQNYNYTTPFMMGSTGAAAPSKMEEYSATEPFYDSNPMFPGAAQNAGMPDNVGFHTEPISGGVNGNNNGFGDPFSTAPVSGFGSENGGNNAFGDPFSTAPVSGFGSENGGSNGFDDPYSTAPVSGFGAENVGNNAFDDPFSTAPVSGFGAENGDNNSFGDPFSTAPVSGFGEENGDNNSFGDPFSTAPVSGFDAESGNNNSFDDPFSTAPVSNPDADNGFDGGNGFAADNGFDDPFSTAPVSNFGSDNTFGGNSDSGSNSGFDADNSFGADNGFGMGSGFGVDSSVGAQQTPEMQHYESTLPLGGVQYYNQGGSQKSNSAAAKMDDYAPTAPTPLSASYGYSPYRSKEDQAKAPKPAEMIQPVLGWFVAIDGPHKGGSFQILPNWNYIGRDASNTITIPGDPEISRINMGCVCYMPDVKKYYFAAGQSRNVIRVNNNPIVPGLAVELWDRDIICMGKTKLMFVALCGEDFDWNE